MSVSRMSTAVFFVLFFLPCILCADDKVDHVKVHGNYNIHTDEILEIAAVEVGDEVNETVIAQVRDRLLKSGHFDAVTVDKRYRNLSGTGPVALVITVVESKSLLSKLLYLPVLGFTDDKKLFYGTKVGGRDIFGLGERYEGTFVAGGEVIISSKIRFDYNGEIFDYVTLSGTYSDAENFYYDMDEKRYTLETTFGNREGYFLWENYLRVDEVEFADLDDRYYTLGLRLTYDTRDDITLPGNAIFVSVDWEHLEFAEGSTEGGLDKIDLDLRAYKRLIGRSQLAGQVFYSKAGKSLPTYLKQWLGGASRLRGHREGEYLGDSYFIYSGELRVPFSSPGNLDMFGMHAFYNRGAVFDHSVYFMDAQYYQGAGIGAFYLFAGGTGIKVEVGNDLEGHNEYHLSGAFRF